MLPGSDSLSESEMVSQPKVLTTIKPLQMIVHELSEGVFQPSRLLPDGFTPHDYHLKPRDRMAVQDADLIVWLGPVTEPYLTALIAQLDDEPSSRRVNVSLIEGLEILPSRSISGHSGGHGGEHAAESKPHGDAHDTAHGVSGFGLDGHIWLSPKNTRLIAQSLADTLSEMDAAHHDQYQQNLVRFLSKMDAIDLTRKSTSSEFLVYHDAFQYLESSLQVFAHDIIVSDSEDTPGIRHIIGVQKSIQRESIQCVVVGTYYNKSLLDKLFSYKVYRTALIDPLASTMVVGQDYYADFLQQSVNQLLSCGSLPALASDDLSR